jgi:hypothetical protein
MGNIVPALAIALSVASCGGSSTNGGDGGPGGSCNIAPGNYAIHWAYISGGSQCQQSTPADTVSASDGGISGGGDAGGCPLVQNGCTYSASCNIALGDAGSEQFSETITINSDGTITGTLSYTYAITFGGMSTMGSCAYSLRAAKQ